MKKAKMMISVVATTKIRAVPTQKSIVSSAARFSLKKTTTRLPMAVIISLLGFMEAISIAKAMAARTRQRLDANQELVGQGLGNIFSSLSSGYAVSGSFSRSAVNINAGAVTGFLLRPARAAMIEIGEQFQTLVHQGMTGAAVQIDQHPDAALSGGGF